MRILGAITLALAIVSTPVAAQDDEIKELSANTLPYAYDAFAAKPLGVASIASIVSQDFRNAPDEFAQWDYLQRLLPGIKKKIADARQNNRWLLQFGSQLGRYDFDQMAFPSGIGAATFIPVRGGFAVKFTNPEQAAFVPIAIEQARKFATHLRNSRQITIEVEGACVSGAPAEMNGENYSVLAFKAEKITLKLADGTVLAAKKI